VLSLISSLAGNDRHLLNFMSAGLNVVTMSCIIPFLVT
jgi:hypothetical protein